MKGKRIVIGLVAVLALAAVVLGAVQYHLQRSTERNLAEFVQSLPPEVEMAYGAVDLGFLGRHLTVDDVRMRMGDQSPVTIDRIHVLEFDRGNEPPEYMHARLLGVEQDLAGLGQEHIAALQALGYSRVRGDYEIDYRFSRQDGELDLRRLAADLHGIGSLSASLRMSNFDPEGMAKSPDRLLQARVRGARVSYTDDSLVRNLLRQAATLQQMSEQEVVERLLVMLDEQLKTQQSPFMQQLRQQLGIFLTEPGMLAIEAAPVEPIAVMDLVAYFMVRPADAPELLQLRVEAQ